MASHSTTAHRRRDNDRRWKGERHSFISRVPVDLAEKVKQSAEADGITYSDWIIEAIAAKAGVDLPAGLINRPSGDNTVQEEIPMRTAV